MVGQAQFEDAVRSFWTVRDRQALTGRGEGSGGAVRGGRHFDAVCELVSGVFLDAGFKPSQLRTGLGATLPGFFRPSKNWDLVVVDGRNLVAAIEFKALGGPSFGNNFNNRAEEALGNALDLWTSYQAGNLGSRRPWLGYFFLIEDAAGSRTPSSRISNASVGTLDPAFRGSSYCTKAEALCLRLMEEKLYDGVCFAATSRDPGERPSEPNEALSWKAFSDSLRTRLSRPQRADHSYLGFDAVITNPPHQGITDDSSRASRPSPEGFVRQPRP